MARPRKRKQKPSGILTVLALVVAGMLLALLASRLRQRQPQRVPVASPQEVPAGAEPQNGEIRDEERRELNGILSGEDRR